MSFEVAAENYGNFMGVFSAPLAPVFASFARVAEGQRVLDVGCGPGALTAELVGRLGTDSVAAADPSDPFLSAVQRRWPQLEAVRAGAEDLPFPSHSFDAVLAQLVVAFIPDPVAGLREMARVARPTGVVAACVWDMKAHGLLTPFWQAVQAIDPSERGEDDYPGTKAGQLGSLARAAGLREVEEDQLTVEVQFDGFDDWWSRFELGVGPAGDYVNRVDADQLERVRLACAERIPVTAFACTATAFAVRAVA
jgi:SAM-dependent methyltransferase